MKAAVIAKPVEECDLEPQKVTLDTLLSSSSSGSTLSDTFQVQ